MKRILFFFTFVTSMLVAVAQPPKRIEKIEALKVAYITQSLSLTAEEAQKFWPVYNSYMSEIRTAKDKNREDELKFQEEALNIKKKYKPEFKKILNSDERVNKVYKAEMEFREAVKKEVQRRMQQRQQGKQPPPSQQ